jgi:hypothetical protein
VVVVQREHSNSVEVNRSDQHRSEVSKTWRDDRSWRMGGISVLKFCPGSRLGYERGRAEGEQSAGVCPKLIWLYGGVGGLSMGGKWSPWTSGGQLEKDAHTRWLVSGFAESRRTLGWHAETEARYSSGGSSSGWVDGASRTKPKRAESGNDMRYVAMICRGQQRFSVVCR